MSSLGYLLLLMFAIYAALTLFLFFSQSGLIYYPDLPSRQIEATPHQLGLDFESVTLNTTDGEQLAAWFIPASDARATLLLAHGNAGNISHRLDSIRLFNDLQLSVLIFDYRGYGESSGQPSEQGTYLDGEAAWDYLTATRGVDPHDIVIFGRSLGAAIAAHVARKHPPRALILESTFTSVPDFGAEQYRLFPVRLLARIRYDTRAALQDIQVPVLIVHSRGDEIIPFHHGERLYAAANEPKHFLPIQGGHNGGFLNSGRLYLDGLSRFLDTYLKGR